MQNQVIIIIKLVPVCAKFRNFQFNSRITKKEIKFKNTLH